MPFKRKKTKELLAVLVDRNGSGITVKQICAVLFNDDSDDTKNAGFTSGTPWIKVNPNYKEINAKSQVNDPDSIFSCYRKLVQFRKEYPVFVDGRFQLLLEDDENIFAYERKTEDQKLLVICNFYGETVEMPLSEKINDMKLLLGNYKEIKDTTILRPYEARMYIH